MNKSNLLATTVWLALATAHASAADLTKIDRTIGKEPAYETKPKYCLVVLGPEAKTRVWLVLDGDILYADRNGDGDLTAEDERMPKQQFVSGGEGFGAVTIAARAGGNQFSLEVQPKRIAGQQDSFTIWCRPSGNTEFRQRTDGVLIFGDCPSDAPVVHFGGPLTFTILDWHNPLQQPQLKRTENNRLSLLIGNPVLGGKRPAFATIVPRQSFRGLAGDETFPLVLVEFPGKEAGAKSIVAPAQVYHCE